MHVAHIQAGRFLINRASGVEQGTLGGPQCSAATGAALMAKQAAMSLSIQECGIMMQGILGMDVACISALISRLKGALYRALGPGC